MITLETVRECSHRWKDSNLKNHRPRRKSLSCQFLEQLYQPARQCPDCKLLTGHRDYQDIYTSSRYLAHMFKHVKTPVTSSTISVASIHIPVYPSIYLLLCVCLWPQCFANSTQWSRTPIVCPTLLGWHLCQANQLSSANITSIRSLALSQITSSRQASQGICIAATFNVSVVYPALMRW